ncbi:protein virilizer isoform X2 [Bradysia coprophila]|uniref:protein virilizer isoform X2 n=1 Tax=Bradysia coprophila TaxID=38358 RepID=UPI00187DCA1E|nr:protein virilizer isoform X2 [Bradysia coprophila]
MADDEAVQLLFFDTFPHEVNEELNLDLVQFPKPVYITEVRIIPLGARVKADFAGGDRLGATNPSKFNIEFFVNDLGKPGSSFESLGNLEYNQNDCIHLDCVKKDVRQIPTDGLVLRGWYTTITLAVYGTLTNGITESPQEEVLVAPPPAVEKVPAEPEAAWQPPEEEIHPREEVYIEFESKPFTPPQFHHTEPLKDNNRPFVRQPDRTASSESDWDREAEDEERAKHPENSPVVRATSREISRTRDCSRGYSRSSSRERDFLNRSKRDWSRSPEYRRSRRRTESYERAHRDVSREHDKELETKRPRTPPILLSPKRPRTPDQASPVGSVEEVSYKGRGERKYSEKSVRSVDNEPKAVSPVPMDLLVESPIGGVDESSQGGEAFEPILSDEEINDECEGQFDMDYDDNDCEEFIKCVDPTTTTLERFADEQRSIKEVELSMKIVHKYKLRDDVASFKNFDSLAPESKEAWIHCTENFVQMLQLIHNFPYSKRNEMLDAILNEHIDTLVDWVRIGIFCAMFQPQAVYKIRHIKIGARLTELLGCCHSFLHTLLYKEKLNIFAELLNLYYQQHMALSIKLMIIKAIYSCLDLKIGVAYFLTNWDTENGYQKLISAIQANPLTRAKFALKAVLKKINLFESLELLRVTIDRIFMSNEQFLTAESDLSLLETTLLDVLKSFTTEAIHFSQPKRYLPVSATFEIVKDLASIRSTAATFQSYFDCHAFIECILLMISHQHVLPSVILDLCLEMVKALTNCNCGLDYLYNKPETTGVLVKCLIGTVSDENPESLEEDIDTAKYDTGNHKLGIEIVYKIKTKFFLDAIQNITDDNELGETFNLFYSLTTNPVGKHHVVSTISMENNLMILLDVIEKEKKSELTNQSSPGSKIKSPYIGYCVDLIDLTVRNASNTDYLEECGNILLNLCKNHETFEPTISLVLQEIAIYLKPLEIPNIFQYDDITELCDLIKRCTEFVTNFPGELITSLRLIKHMAISNVEDERADDHVELKHKYVVLKFYSADGIATMVSILDKLNSYFEQPAVHMAALASNQGLLATQIICPAVQVLRKMLTYVIQSRNTQYKDLTVIEHLLKTFNLMHFVQPHSGTYYQAKTIQDEIIKILLAYTQPTPVEGLDTESVHKSIWTQMIGELTKHILSGPHTFISGLLVFSELLPLPLPVLTKSSLSEAEVTRLITERQLWSAHLHPKSAILTEMIQTICTSSYPELLNILRRVCVQLADLAPNMSLLVSKAILDLLLLDTPPSSALTLRLLRFLSMLIVEPTIKITVLSILPGKFYDLLAVMTSSSALKLQKIAYGIFEILLDSDLGLVPFETSKGKATTISCALPSKDLLPSVVNLFVENFLKVGNDSSVYALNMLLLLARYDYTLYLLRTALEKEKEKILKVIAHLTSSIKVGAKQQFLSAFIEFFTSLTIANELTHRQSSLAPSDLASILSWPTKNLNELYHPLEQLKNAIEPLNADKSFNDILDKLNILFKILNSKSTSEASDFTEPAFPLSEGIVVQFAERPVYQLIDDNPELNPLIQSSYWLGYPSFLDKIDEDVELIACDLCELAKTALPSETNITSDCKRLLHLTASPQSNRERTTAAPCFRTRRVEVEPTTGRPEKKIYVTRGRGFPRTPPTRGDLFRSRPPNTSRPPSLHVDDFLALETCGAQPTGPTGYNKLSRDIISIRGTRGRGRGFVDRGRGSAMGVVNSASPYRQTTNSPSTWQSHGAMEATGPPQHYRTATAEPVGHFQGDYGPSISHFGTPMRGGRIRGSTRPPRTFARQ